VKTRPGASFWTDSPRAADRPGYADDAIRLAQADR
jgi:hypothetical protein